MTKAKRLTINFRAIPWPMPGDQLFNDDSDWWHNAHLNLGGKGWESYAAGYKDAADSLARRFLKNWQGNDILTYPMVFCYRHYLELRLKQIIILGQMLLAGPIRIKQEILEKRLENDHNLTRLWEPCREIIEGLGNEGYWPKDSVQQLDIVQNLINEFEEKDGESINFRYPVTKKKKGGQPTLPYLNLVGVRNLTKVMQRLDSFFTAQLAGIDFYLSESGD
jgi:hypothetical protein